MRNEWKFKYNTTVLLNAASDKIDYYEDRVSFWTEELEKAEKAVKESQVEIKQYPVTGGKRMEVKIDPTLSRRYDECSDKLEQHKKNLKKFETYWRAFHTSKDKEFELDLDDIEYFDL